MAGSSSAWQTEAQRLKSEIKSALEAYPSPSPVRRPGPSAAPLPVSTPPDDNIVRLQQQINQVHDFVHDTERKDLLIQDLRTQVAELIKERGEVERKHEGADAQLELARRQEEAQAKLVASLRRKLEDAERHQLRDTHDAASAQQLLQKRVETVEAERWQLQTERDSLLAENQKLRKDAESAGDAATARDAAVSEATRSQAEARELRQELDETKRLVDDARENVAQLEQQIAVNDMRMSTLIAERDGLRQELSGLRDDLSAAAHEAAERNQAKRASVEHQRAAEAAQKEILQLQARLTAAEDEKASAQRKLEVRRKEFEQEHTRYEAKAKETAEALQRVASLSASESEASRLRARLSETEAELAESQRVATATSEQLTALGLRFETSEAALHSAARVIQAALEDTLASVGSRDDSNDDSQQLRSIDGDGSQIDLSMDARGEHLKQAGTDAGVLANVCNSVGEICRALRLSERRVARAETAVRAMKASARGQQQERVAHHAELKSAEQRIATASATAAAQAAALQKISRELEEERMNRATAEQELQRRQQQFGRIHEQLCGLRRLKPGETIPDAQLSWTGLIEDARARIQAIQDALRLEESRHEMAVEAAAHAEASLARARLEIEEKSERAAAAARRNADAQAAASAAHAEEIKKAVHAERKRAEDQVTELVASYGSKIRMIEAEFTRSASRLEAAEQTAMAKAQLVEESNRQVAEAERRASVLKAEAERCNEHAADMERRAASALKMQREAEANIARAESERGAASRRSMHLEGELSRAQAQIESLTKDRDEASEQLSTLDQRVAEVTAAAARMQEEALTAQAQMNRQASDAVHAAEIRVRTEMQSVIKDKEAEIGELHKDIQELRQLAAAAQRDHDKVASEVEQELHALAAQHREVVATLEERDAEASNLQASIAECEGAATLLAKERDQLAQELRLATEGEAASTRVSSNLHKELMARAQQLDSIRSQMAQQTDQVESLTKALNEASTAKDMALHHAAEVDAELQSLKRHAAQLSEQLASTMAGRAVGTLSGLDTVVAGERQARAAAAAATVPPSYAPAAEPGVPHRAMPRPWDVATAVRMPTDPTAAAAVGGGADASVPDGQRSKRTPSATQNNFSAGRASAPQDETRPPPVKAGAGTAGWLSDEQELGRYIRSLDAASTARQERVTSQHARQSNSAGGSVVDEGTRGRRNPQAVFARWDGSESDEVEGVPTAAASRDRKRGKPGDAAGSIRPTNAWR